MNQPVQMYSQANLEPVLLNSEKSTKSRIDEIRADPSLSMLERRRLVKAEVANYGKVLRIQADAAMKAEVARQSARTEVEEKAITAQKIHIMTQLQARFGDMMNTLGQQVSSDNLNHQVKFAETLTGIRDSLATKKIEPRFQTILNQQIDKAFDDYIAKMSEVFSNNIS